MSGLLDQTRALMRIAQGLIGSPESAEDNPRQEVKSIKTIGKCVPIDQKFR